MTVSYFYYDEDEVTNILMGDGSDIRVLDTSGVLDWPDRMGSAEAYGDKQGGFDNGYNPLGIRRVVMSVGVHIEKDGEATEALLQETLGILAKSSRGLLVSLRSGKNPRTLFCRPKRAEFPGSWDVGMGLARGVLEFESTDPVWHGLEATYETGMMEASGGRTYDRTYPMTYGALGDGGSVVVTNGGNLESYPVMRVYGPVDTPVITNLAQDKIIKVNVDIAADSYLEINLAKHTLLMNGTGNQRSALDPSSRWFTFDPGDTEILFNGNVFDADATLQIDMYNAWATA